MVTNSFFEIKNLVMNLNQVISQSKYKRDYVIKNIGISKATYYHKIKSLEFTVNELEKIINILFEDEKNVIINDKINQSVEEIKNGKTIDFMKTLNN